MVDIITITFNLTNNTTMKKIYKYPTGAEIPEGAIYLGTVIQTKEPLFYSNGNETKYTDCWYVWHYFLVTTND